MGWVILIVTSIVSSPNNLLQRYVVLSAADRRTLRPKFTQMSRTAVRTLVVISVTANLDDYLSHSIVTIRWPGPSCFARVVAATPD